MPFHVPPVADEREGLKAFLRQQQQAFEAVAYGLTDAQAGQRSTPSELTVGTLVKHATSVQQAWLTGVLAAPDLPAEEGTFEERMAARERELTWLEDDTLEAVLQRHREVSEAVLRAVDAVDLDTPYPVPPAPWSPPDVTHWSVRWVWLHLIEELARHAGHADIIREAIDGATMYELIAGLEGFPETPWLKPWRPPA